MDDGVHSQDTSPEEEPHDWSKADPDVQVARETAVSVVKQAAARNYNKEYGYPDSTTVIHGHRGYGAADVTDDEVPLSMDLVTFTLWYLKEVGVHLPPDDLEKLGDLVIHYTGE